MGEVREEQEQEQFRNTTRGWISVVKVDRRGDAKAEALEGGGTVWLTKEEQQLTIKQHRNPQESNPFIDHDFEITDPETGAVVDAGRRPILMRVSEETDLPTSPERADAPDQPGAHAPAEETGIPTS